MSLEIITLVTSLHFLSNLYFGEDIFYMQRAPNDRDKALARSDEGAARGRGGKFKVQGNGEMLKKPEW